MYLRKHCQTCTIIHFNIQLHAVSSDKATAVAEDIKNGNLRIGELRGEQLQWVRC